jgi:hypothetical protein
VSVIPEREPVLLHKMRIGKVSVADAQLFTCFDVLRTLEHHKALILNLVVETTDYTVRTGAVVDVVKKRHHHEDGVRVRRVLVW